MQLPFEAVIKKNTKSIFLIMVKSTIIPYKVTYLSMVKIFEHIQNFNLTLFGIVFKKIKWINVFVQILILFRWIKNIDIMYFIKPFGCFETLAQGQLFWLLFLSSWTGNGAEHCCGTKWNKKKAYFTPTMPA